MSLERVKSLMKKVAWGAFATTDGNIVGVRPMGGWAWMGDELWCPTSAPSDKVAQLEKVPDAEYCFGKPEGEHARIAGPCTISANNADKLKLYEAVPLLKNYIEDPTSPEYVVIRMKPERIRVMEAAEKDRITMSNKKTIKRTAEPVKKMKKEEKKFSLTKSRMKLAGMIPAIVFIVIAIWYFISSLQ